MTETAMAAVLAPTLTPGTHMSHKRQSKSAGGGPTKKTADSAREISKVVGEVRVSGLIDHAMEASIKAYVDQEISTALAAIAGQQTQSTASSSSTAQLPTETQQRPDAM